MKAFLIVIAVFVGLVGFAAVGSALNLITIPWLKFDSKVQMERDIVTKTYNADNALYNYHWFQEEAGKIKTAGQNIDVASSTLAEFKATAGPSSSWDYSRSTQYSNYLTVYQGSKQYYNDLVNNYNARAKSVDRSMFVDDLPLFFDLR